MQSRYYDPDVKRFINADGLISVDQEFLGNNLYTYCGNNPITYVDYTGNRLTVGGGGSQDSLYETLKVTDSEHHDYVKGTEKPKSETYKSGPSPRKDLAEAPDLNIKTASDSSYNCYGNGIGKQIFTDPTGYTPGDSTAKTYEAVKSDLGGDRNVRRLNSINSIVNADEFKVAMKCGQTDYHFIRLTSQGWYTKSGEKPGIFIHQGSVASDIWYAVWKNNGIMNSSTKIFYDDETIYFAVKTGWDVQ